MVVVEKKAVKYKVGMWVSRDNNTCKMTSVAFCRNLPLTSFFSSKSMQLQEAVFCATASSSGSGFGAITLHDILTGSSLATFKQTNAAPHCTAYLESKKAQGGFFLAAQPDKSLLHVFNFQKVHLGFTIFFDSSHRIPGSNHLEDCITRKINMCCSRSSRRLLCWWDYPRKNTLVGG